MKENLPWSIAEGKKENGKPYFLRFLELYPTAEEQEKFSFLIEITWDYQEANSSGMPDPETYDLMNSFEDILKAEIESPDLCVFVLTLTGDGEKIWQVYGTDPELFVEKLNQVMEGREVLPLQIDVFQDKEWNGYKEFVDLLQ